LIRELGVSVLDVERIPGEVQRYRKKAKIHEKGKKGKGKGVRRGTAWRTKHRSIDKKKKKKKKEL